MTPEVDPVAQYGADGPRECRREVVVVREQDETVAHGGTGRCGTEHVVHVDKTHAKTARRVILRVLGAHHEWAIWHEGAVSGEGQSRRATLRQFRA